jgi:hypothetical protein
MTKAATRAALWASVAASAALAAFVSLLPRASERSALEPSGVNAIGSCSSDEGQLVDSQVGATPRDPLREGLEAATAVRATQALEAGDRAVRALAQRLSGPDYQRVTFETEARARLACLPDGALAAIDDLDPTLSVARAVLTRVSSATLAERRAAVRADLPHLREALRDERFPRAVTEQAAAALAALGDDADRARLFADAADPSFPRAALAARIGLESLEGPGTGLSLVEAAVRADGFLAIVPAWTQAHGPDLAPAEREACADTLRTIAGDALRDAAARSRALSGLRALDPEQAATASLAWLRDASADAALVRGACGSVSSGLWTRRPSWR